MRLLIEVARVPSAEMEGLWHDLLHNPSALKFNPRAAAATGPGSGTGPGPGVGGDSNGASGAPQPHQALLALMRMRTSRRFVFSVIPYELEQKLVFIFSNVKTRFHRRYFDWIQQKVPIRSITSTCIQYSNFISMPRFRTPKLM